MEKLKERLQTALGLDSESVDQLASYVTFQGTPEAMEDALEEILGDGDQARLLIEEYFGGQNKSPAPKDDLEASSGTSTPVGIHELNTEELKYMNLLRGSNWATGSDTANTSKAKKKANTRNNTPSSSKVKIDSLSDIEAALRQVELGTSRSSLKRTECNCMGTRHPLVEAAPNCLNCGRIICMKEGLGPCFFCGEPLISEDGMRKILTILNSEKSDISSTMGRKAREAAMEKGINLSESRTRSKNDAEARLNKLLDFQDTSAQRTKIIDEVSDFDTTSANLNMWASPEEQVKQLKKQQKQLRKLEEQKKARSGRARKVISIDLHGNKVVLREKTPVEGDSDYEMSGSDPDENDDGKLSSIKTGSDNKEIRPDKKKASAYWEAKSYGKNFINPIYVHDEDEKTSNSKGNSKGNSKSEKSTRKAPKQSSHIPPSEKLVGASRLEFDDDEDEALVLELLA